MSRQGMSRLITRREALRGGVASGGALGTAALLSNSLIARALAAPKPPPSGAADHPTDCASLDDIEHVVILIQENRSFDHYFGSYRGVRGFGDPNVLQLGDGSGLSIFAQPGYPGGFDGDHLYPFHLNSYDNGECTNDINHSWGPQHTYWDGGKLDGFVTGHLAVDGAANGPLAMGYYTRKDLSFYYALADAFTVCDGYYCSVIGPTDPNRLYSMSAWLDPAGTQGGPILSTSTTRVERFGTLSSSEHPPAPTEYGEVVAAQVLNTLVSNPSVWAKTALFITYDENGGFFDHVPPPVAPGGTPGEYLTVNPLPSDASGVAGPIGLGFRVPLLVVSPFSRGGFVCSDTFDHTSLLRFLETRFGAEVPNVTPWRRSLTGDLTSAFNFAKVDASVPSLPQPSAADSRVTMSSCATSAPFDELEGPTNSLSVLEQYTVASYPVTVNSAAPPQEPGAAPRPSGPVACTA